MQKLPIGIQTFRDIREGDYIYIDKTAIAYELIESYKYVFLSRPRRFGKSLFLDTLKNIFEGNREYFKGLAIEEKWDWSVKYPVIKISFGAELRSPRMVKEALQSCINRNKKNLGVECQTKENVSLCFAELIENAYKKHNQKVVVLIDEYDKAILDNLDQMEVAKEAREIIKGFYTVLKEADPYLRFAFLTGVSKFSKASIFSGLNMLVDISLDAKFGNICGYTHENLLQEFREHFEGADMGKVRRWYNGYNFLGDPLYNPFDILQFLAKDHKFKNYWFATSTPTFLIKLIEKNHYFLPKLSNLVVGEQLLDSFDIDNLDLEVILYQAGYLTIQCARESRRGDIEYQLKLPNEEVKISLSDALIDFMTAQKTEKIGFQNTLLEALEEEQLEDFKVCLSSVFASIPYHHFTKNRIADYEGFYASVVYVYLQSLGVEIIGEDVRNMGRIDLTIKPDQAIYIIEFKTEGKENALQQIKERGYAKAYLNQKKPIYLVGIHFDTEERNISLFEWERIKP